MTTTTILLYYHQTDDRCMVSFFTAVILAPNNVAAGVHHVYTYLLSIYSVLSSAPAKGLRRDAPFIGISSFFLRDCHLLPVRHHHPLPRIVVLVRLEIVHDGKRQQRGHAPQPIQSLPTLVV